MYHSFFIHSSVNGHPFSTDNKDKEWCYVLVKFVGVSLAFISQIKIAGLKGEHSFNFTRYRLPNCSLKQLYKSTIPSTMCKISCFFKS